MNLCTITNSWRLGCLKRPEVVVFSIIYQIYNTKTLDCILTTLEGIVFNHSYVLCTLDFIVVSLMYVSMSVCLSVCVSVCPSVCVFPPTEVISQLILKCDTWLNASLPNLGSYVHNFMIYTGWFERNAPKV